MMKTGLRKSRTEIYASKVIVIMSQIYSTTPFIDDLSNFAQFSKKQSKIRSFLRSC